VPEDKTADTLSHLHHFGAKTRTCCSMTFGFFTARRYASAIYAVVVCLSVRLTQAGTAPKGYTRDHANNAISDVNISTKFQCDHPNRGRQI